jgi:hypothetical protein
MQDSHSPPSVPSRYFFRVTRNGTCMGHSEGLDFPDQAAAWREAAMSCGQIILEMDAEIEPGCHWQMEVSDAGGKPIYRFTFTADEV